MNATVAPNPLVSGDRRRHRRFPDPDLTVSVDGNEFSVLDLSVGGVRLATTGLMPAEKVTVTLTTRIDGPPDTIQTKAEVVAAGSGQCSLAFSTPTYALMHFIVHFLAHRHGVEPHLFR